MDAPARLTADGGGFVRATGRFWRGVPGGAAATALAGSVAGGRYSRPGQATLYLSASPDGVAAALQARGPTSPIVQVPVTVRAERLLDLRDRVACASLGIDPLDAMTPWHEAAAGGVEPLSWGVRDRAEQAGARGLVDPSRRAPGSWHLVLFAPWTRAAVLATEP